MSIVNFTVGEDFDQGGGTSCDDLCALYKRLNHPHYEAKQSREEIDKILATDRMAQKIINIPVYDGLGNWRDIESEEKANRDAELELKKVFSKALADSRKYGRVAIYPIIEKEGGGVYAPSVPMDKIESGSILRVINVNDVDVSAELDQNPNSQTYGEPKNVTLGNLKNLHPSRVVLIGGEVSFFNSIGNTLYGYYEGLRRLHLSVKQSRAFALRTNIGDFMNMLQAQEEATGKRITVESALQTRARAMKLNLNQDNMVVLGEGEEIIDFQSRNVSHITEYVEMLMQTLSGAADIPISRLFGKNSTGLSQNFQSDFLNYTQALESMRAEMVTDGIDKMDGILQHVEGLTGDWTWNPTKAEESRLALSGVTEPNA